MEPNNVQAAIEFAKQHLKADVITVGNEATGTAPAVMLPASMNLKSIKEIIDEFRQAPERREGHAIHQTLDSFIAHANRFKDGDSAIFADLDRQSPSMLAVLDYHRKGPTGAPRFGNHYGELPFEHSDQWKEWNAINKRPLTVEQFSDFLEAHCEDVVDPAGLKSDDPTALLQDKLQVKFATPAHVLAAARGLQIRVTQEVADVKVLETGEVDLKFQEKHEAAGGMRAPAAFAIAIPVFRSGEVFYIAVRLRYRLIQGRVAWQIVLYRLDRVYDAAIKEAAVKAQKDTELPLFFGIPEGFKGGESRKDDGSEADEEDE